MTGGNCGSHCLLFCLHVHTWLHFLVFSGTGLQSEWAGQSVCRGARFSGAGSNLVGLRDTRFADKERTGVIERWSLHVAGSDWLTRGILSMKFLVPAPPVLSCWSMASSEQHASWHHAASFEAHWGPAAGWCVLVFPPLFIESLRS